MPRSPGLVQINIPGSNSKSAGLGLQNLIQVFHHTQGQFEDNLIYTRGRHQIKAGFQFVRERQDYIYAGNNGALGLLSIGTATGSGLADFWLGNVAGGTGSLRDYRRSGKRPSQTSRQCFWRLMCRMIGA